MSDVKIPEKIAVDELRRRIAYDPASGAMVWKPRPEEDFPSRKSFMNWSARFPGKPALVSVSADGYLRGELAVSGVRVHLQAHRVAFAIYWGRHPQDEIDHINGDRADNRIDNLRECTHEQNVWNSVKRSRYLPGVSAVGTQWKASIRANGQSVHLGVFDTEQQAHASYVAAANEIRGEFSPFQAIRSSHE